MNMPSAFPAEPADSPARGRTAAPGAAALRRVPVWDAPVRVFHWLMVLCFAAAWLTSESERWRLVHISAGYTMVGLVLFRLLWGVIGTRHARFASFVRGPRAVAAHVRELLHGREAVHTGHNPAGAVAVVLMLGLTLAVTATGWANLNEWGGHAMEEIHEAAATLMLTVVGVHLAGVILGSWMTRDNLVGAMFTGRKLGDPAQAIRRAWSSVAVLMLAAVLGFWAWQWQSAPAAGGLGGGETQLSTPGGDAGQGAAGSGRHADKRAGRGKRDHDD